MPAHLRTNDPAGEHLLTVNAGSSSVKFALFAVPAAGDGEALRLAASGQVDGLGASPRLVAKAGAGALLHDTPLPQGTACTHADALSEIFGLLERALPAARVAAVGHRVVHGGARFDRPVPVDDALVATLHELAPLAPLHLPHGIAGIEATRRVFPGVPQVACFDTAFHRGQDFLREAYALPRRFYDEGVRRYGFHGLSYEYIARRLRQLAPGAAAGRVVVAHLGNGASMCAMRGGHSVASTMGFTALDGLPMGTRCGAIDPGVVLHLTTHYGLDADAVSSLLYKDSGLKGLSGLSHDMRVLEASESPDAQQAIDYFCNRIRHEAGALAAELQGIDAFVFTAGIGEHSQRVRRSVLEGLGWLGISLDREANAGRGDRLVSTPGSAVQAWVIATDEEAMIARHTLAVAGLVPEARGVPA